MNIVSRGGRGEEWSGDACVAHGGRGAGRRALPLRGRWRPLLIEHCFSV